VSVTLQSTTLATIPSGTAISTSPGDGGVVQVVQLPGTQAVSLATAPSTPVTNIGTFAVQATGPAAAALALDATLTGGSQVVQQRAAILVVSTTGAASAAVTATLPAAGAGLFHYITRINIMKYATAALTGSATPIVVTSTNLPGSVAWTTPTALAIGTQYETDVQGSSPLKSLVANTATTIVAPIHTSALWRINVYYYTAP
jgi:hypothetical protein